MNEAHTNHTLLIVDDEKPITEALSSLFEDRGYCVSSARSAEEARKIMEHSVIEVVLSEVRMPERSGIDLLKWIKKNHPMTEVIIMTGYASVEDGVSALKEGAYDYLIKPFRSLEEVMLVVDKAVSLRRVKIENAVLRKGVEGRVQERTRELEKTMNALKRTQTQLVHQEKMASIGQLAAGVAHEINNPVAFVSTNLRTLKEYMEEISRLIAKYDEAEQTMKNGDHSRMRSLITEIHTLKQEMGLEFILGDFGQIIEESLEGTERIRRIVMDLKHFSHQGESE
ncbi:MAG: response regulator, partial [Candidatus Latescibacteria bacterium]|nr:response regulator [Candidatus Latescibacterota bacterium]